MMGETGPSLQRFLAALDSRLQQLSVTEIRTALHAHARSLPPDQREKFLGIFSRLPATDSQHPDLIWPVGDHSLPADIDAFVARVAAGAYFEGYGWDDELGDERSFGDDSWVWEMEGLFAEAAEAFLANKLGLARAAYGRLLKALRLDEEVGTFSGTLSAPEMLETDIGEAEARHLRAVYETTPPRDRASTLLEEWSAFSMWDGGPSLRAVRETRQRDLPDLATFLPAWIVQLRLHEEVSAGVRTLLVEAVETHGGVDGLAALARDSSAGHQTEYYLEWINALRRADRDPDAANAAREALKSEVLKELHPYGGTRALIAEQLAAVTTDPAETLDARRAAWRSSPTQARLLALHHAAAEQGQAQSFLSAEVEGTPQDRIDDQLRAVLLLLVGRIDAAIECLEDWASTGRGRDPSRVLVPYLLTAGCAGPTRTGWKSSRLHALLEGVNTPDIWDWTNVERGTAGSAPESVTSLSVLFAEQIADHPDDPDLRSRCLLAAVAEIDRRLEAIVGGQRRNQYGAAARLIACAAEAVALAESPDSGTRLVARRRDRYPRHVAFRRELELAVKKTPLVRPPAPRTAR